MADFLALGTYRSNGLVLPDPYHTPPLLQHKAIADFYLGHFHTKWQSCDAYGLRHLAWHLIQAGKTDELHQLLLTFDWLQAKLEATDLAALIADYDYLPEDKDLQLVQSAIRLSAHVLARDQRQLASQLTGRLLGIDDNDIQALLKQTAEKAPRPSLWPLRGHLTPPGGPLIRMLEGHSVR